MKKEFFQKIAIPDGVEAKIDGSLLTVKGKGGENSRKFKTYGLVFAKEGDEIVIGSKKSTKNEKKIINTTKAHVKNMIKGVQEQFEYKLKICYNHFPFTVELKGHEALIKNFLGEKIPRKVSIPRGAEVKIEKEILKVTSPSKEIAGQAAANFENATRIRLRDRRVFQDGLFIIEKNGREM